MMNSRLVWRNVCNWMAVAIAVGVLSACGGGTKSSPTSVNATLTIPVGEIAAFGIPSTFVITGSNLRDAFFVERESTCNDFSISLKANDLIKFTCTPTDIFTNIVVVNSKGETAGEAKITLPEPTDISLDSITADDGVTLGIRNTFTITGNRLLDVLLDPTAGNVIDPSEPDPRPYVAATGCIKLIGRFENNVLSSVSCIPTSKTVVFTVKTIRNKFPLSQTVDLSGAPFLPISPTGVFADIKTELNIPNKFTVKGNFFDFTESTITSADCTSLTVDNSSRNGLQVELTCTPTKKGVDFNIKDLSTPSATDTTTWTSLLPARVVMTTSLGNLTIAIDRQRAPITSTNFLQYVNDGYYVGTIFHRVAKNFVDQGGGFTSPSALSNNIPKSGLRTSITLEPPATTGLSNKINTIAMARTNVLNSATSQFFFNAVDNIFLDTNGGGYAVFGEVVSGVDVIQTINNVPKTKTTAGDDTEVPATDVVIQSVVQVQ